MQEANPGSVKITILSGYGNDSADVPLTKPESLIGRAPDCDIVLEHPTVSGRHARVYQLAGTYYLEDLQSTNGSAVNGAAINGPAALKPGDLLQVGEVHLLFQQDSPMQMPESGASTMVYGDPAGDTGGSTMVYGEGMPDTGGATMVYGEQAGGFRPPTYGDQPAEGSTMVYDQGSPFEVGESAPVPSLEKQSDAPYQSYEGEQRMGDMEQSFDQPWAASTGGGTAIDPADAGPVDVLAGPRDTIRDIVDKLQAALASVNGLGGALDPVDSALDEARGDRQRTSVRLDSLTSALNAAVGDSEAKAADLKIEESLSTLQSLANSPNDLALLVQVSRDAGRYVSLLRLHRDLLDKLRDIAASAS